MSRVKVKSIDCVLLSFFLVYTRLTGINPLTQSKNQFLPEAWKHVSIVIMQIFKNY